MSRPAFLQVSRPMSAATVTASVLAAPGAFSRVGAPKRCHPVADQWMTGARSAVPLAGRGTRRVPPFGWGRSFSLTQQRSRFSVPAASAAWSGSGCPRGSSRPDASGRAAASRRSSGSVPAGFPAGVRRVPCGPTFCRGTLVDSKARGPSGRFCPRCWLVRGPSASGAGVGFTAVFLGEGSGISGSARRRPDGTASALRPSARRRGGRPRPSPVRR